MIERWRARRQDSLRRMRNLPEPPIRPLRNYELIDLGVAEPYYRPRRGYMNAAGWWPRTSSTARASGRRSSSDRTSGR